MNFGPDLTKEQRKEEMDMKKKMEDKSRALSEDEKAKNLAWRIVGLRGEGRLIKGAVRAQEAGRLVGHMAASTRGVNTGGLNTVNSTGGRSSQ